MEGSDSFLSSVAPGLDSDSPSVVLSVEHVVVVTSSWDSVIDGPLSNDSVGVW